MSAAVHKLLLKPSKQIQWLLHWDDVTTFTRSSISSSKFLHFRITQLGPEAISRPIGLKSGVAPTDDFGRYTCMQYWCQACKQCIR